MNDTVKMKETLWHEVNMARENRVGTQEGVGRRYHKKYRTKKIVTPMTRVGGNLVAGLGRQSKELPVSEDGHTDSGGQEEDSTANFIHQRGIASRAHWQKKPRFHT